jgi:hypothetical protein
MTEEPLIIYLNNTAQPLTDQIKVGSRVLTIAPSATVDFNMREADTDVLKVSSAANIVDASKGKVSYSWSASDLNTAGEYFGWWEINDAGEIYETEEFLIIVAKHAPGFRTTVGPIYSAAKSIMPITWNRLEDSPHYGDKQLQNKIEIAKVTLFGTEMTVADEYDMDIRVVDYLAKVAAISVIPAGKDYWASMASSKVSTGTDEDVSYPDRIKMLEELHKQLTQEVSAMRDEISSIVDLPSVRPSNAIPEVSNGTDEGFITPNPHANFRDYGFPILTNTNRKRRAV